MLTAFFAQAAPKTRCWICRRHTPGPTCARGLGPGGGRLLNPALPRGVGRGPHVSVGPVVLRPRFSQTMRATGDCPGRWGWASSLDVGFPPSWESAFGSSCLTQSPTGGQRKGEGCHWVPPGAGESPPALFSWAGRAVGGAAALDKAGGFQSLPSLASGRLGDMVAQASQVLAGTANDWNCATCALGWPFCFGPEPPPLKAEGV